MGKNALLRNNDCYGKIKAILAEARSAAYRHVNSVMVRAYWNIGRIIVEEEQRGAKKAGYGHKLLETLSLKLSKNFGRGFDPTNLWNMRRFYLVFPILDALRQELSWTHYRLLLRVDDGKARNFYLNECSEGNWSTRQLERQIYSSCYERLLVNRNRRHAKRGELSGKKNFPANPVEQIKDTYVLEFLGIKEGAHLRESKVEQALIEHIQSFLLELGRGFSFVARQKHISTDAQHFYIDLVFYNYILKCFVLVDLKVDKLTHQDIGQMDMYVRMFEDKVRGKDDNPTIGIILCAEKDDVIVKYSVLKESKQLFASKYKLCLPSEKELKNEIKCEKNQFDMELIRR